MPLGQKVKVCGRRYKEERPPNSTRVGPEHFPGVKPYHLDKERSSDSWHPDRNREVWCGHFSDHSAFVFLCESCAVENGLKW